MPVEADELELGEAMLFSFQDEQCHDDDNRERDDGQQVNIAADVAESVATFGR